MTQKPDKTLEGGGAAHDTVQNRRCAKVRDLLTAFATNDLGEAQSAFIREHLRQCESCRQVVRQTRQTMQLLRAAGQMPSTVPDRLSDDRHNQIMRAYAQPLLTWMRMYFLPMVGILVAVLLFLAIVYTLAATWRPQPEPVEVGSIVVRLPGAPEEEGPLDPAGTNLGLELPMTALPGPLTSAVDHAVPLQPIPHENVE